MLSKCSVTKDYSFRKIFFAGEVKRLTFRKQDVQGYRQNEDRTLLKIRLWPEPT